MPHINDGTDECGKPSCSGPAANTYRGEHGNTVRVCDRHYYRLVTGYGSTGLDTGIGTSGPLDIVNPGFSTGTGDDRLPSASEISTDFPPDTFRIQSVD